MEEARKAIDSLKNGKAPGPDGRPGEVYHCLDEESHQYLMKKFLDCWRTGAVPRQWFHAVVATLYKKKGEKSDCRNYRGLSLLDLGAKY